MFKIGTSLKRWISGTLVMVLLGLQIATAAYACVATAADGDEQIDMARMANCKQASGTTFMQDERQPGLCYEHCKGTDVSVDQNSAGPQVPAVALALRYEVPPSHLAASSPALSLRTEAVSSHAPPPVLSILHCCYRV